MSINKKIYEASHLRVLLLLLTGISLMLPICALCFLMFALLMIV